MKNILRMLFANILLIVRLQRAAIQIAEHMSAYTYRGGRYHRPQQ